MNIMAHISEAKHRQLLNQIDAVLRNTDARKLQSNDLAFLKKDLELMADIFGTYQSHLAELRRLIAAYQKIYSRARIMLRQQQIAMQDASLDNQAAHSRSKDNRENIIRSAKVVFLPKTRQG
jgi:hypothetical protein